MKEVGMAQQIQFSRTGGSEVLELVEVTPADPAPNEVRIKNQAIGLNFIDIYFRTGLYPAPSMPSGLGTEGAGVGEERKSTRLNSSHVASSYAVFCFRNKKAHVQ